ncbi:MAG: cell surface protein SprA, partial [Runella zeae]
MSCFLWLTSQEAVAQSQPTNRRSTTPDTSHSNRQSRRLLYSTWMDRFGNRFNYVPSRSSLYLRDPKSLSNEFRLDSTGRMSVYERIGDTKLPPLNYRNPLTMSYEDFQKLQDKRVFEYLRREYSAKQDGKGALGARGLLPKLDLPPGFDRVFGSNIVDFKPNGFVLLDFGVINQKNQDPNIPIRQRNQTNFLFNEQININFNGKIGDRLGMLTNFDTKSSFNFENQLKLDYRPGKANLPTTPNVPGMGQTGVGGLGQTGVGGLGQNSTFGQGFGPQSYIPENESIIQGVQAGNVNWQ